MITGDQAWAMILWFVAGVIGLPLICFTLRFCWDILKGDEKW
jgi:hypothetical protein